MVFFCFVWLGCLDLGCCGFDCGCSLGLYWLSFMCYYFEIFRVVWIGLFGVYLGFPGLEVGDSVVLWRWVSVLGLVTGVWR